MLTTSSLPREPLDELLRLVATVDLVPAPDARFIDDATWTQLVATCHWQRITGLLERACTAGLLSPSTSQWDELLEVHRSVLQTSLLLEDDLIELLGVLAQSGLDALVLKGSAVAHLDYSDPAQRTFMDIDLLVHSSQWAGTVAVLESLSMRRQHAELRRDFDRRFGKGACFVDLRGFEIDLHRTFVMGPFGLLIELDRLWDETDSFELAGRPIRALNRDARLLHACYHAALGGRDPRMSQLRDVAQIALHPDQVDSVDRVLQLAASWRGEAVVARAIALTWQSLDLPPCAWSEWSDSYSTRARDRRALRVYLDPELSYAASCIMSVRAIRGMRPRIDYLRALALPDASYGAGRHQDRWVRWSDAIRQLFRLSKWRP